MLMPANTSLKCANSTTPSPYRIKYTRNCLTCSSVLSPVLLLTLTILGGISIGRFQHLNAFPKGQPLPFIFIWTVFPLQIVWSLLWCCKLNSDHHYKLPIPSKSLPALRTTIHCEMWFNYIFLVGVILLSQIIGTLPLMSVNEVRCPKVIYRKSDAFDRAPRKYSSWSS